MALISYGKAIHEAMCAALEKDPAVFVMGLGVDDHKAIFGTTKGLVERFGKNRVFDTPISEAGMTGVAIGAALGGMKPIHIHIRNDFLFLAMDQICNMAAKWHSMFGGQMNVPMVIRCVVGRSWGQGAQHSQSLQAIFMHVPGIKVIMPTTPYDAKGLLLSAISDPNPVLVIEHRLLYDITGEVPETSYEIPFGATFTRRKGQDLTVVANSYMVVESLKAAEFLQGQGIEIEIVDPASLVPLDVDPILRSVQKTGRLLIVDAGWMTCGVSAEVSALVAERGFGFLKQPIRRMGLAQTVCPVSQPLEKVYYPNAQTIAGTVLEMMGQSHAHLEVPLLTHKFKGPF